MVHGRWTVCHEPSAISHVYVLRPLRDSLELRRLAPVQTLRDGERRVHAHDAGVEIELGYALETAGRAFLDADAAAFAVVHENLVEAVRAIEPHDARLGAHEIAVVARVAGAAAEAAR